MNWLDLKIEWNLICKKFFCLAKFDFVNLLICKMRQCKTGEYLWRLEVMGCKSRSAFCFGRNLKSCIHVVVLLTPRVLEDFVVACQTTHKVLTNQVKHGLTCLVLFLAWGSAKIWYHISFLTSLIWFCSSNCRCYCALVDYFSELLMVVKMCRQPAMSSATWGFRRLKIVR